MIFFVKIPYTNEHPVYKYLYLDRRSVSQATTKNINAWKKAWERFRDFLPLFYIFLAPAVFGLAAGAGAGTLGSIAGNLLAGIGK